MLKQIVVWFLIGLFGLGACFPGTDVEEVMKLPALVTHYAEHYAQSNGQTSLVEFLQQHYGKEAAKNHIGNHNHDNLPMVKHQLHLGYWVIPDFSFVPLAHIGQNVIIVHGSLLAGYVVQSFFSKWPQPPRQY
jgi:hypothetical protein